MHTLTLIPLFLLALAGGLRAEGEEKPAFAPPEPKRQSSFPKSFVLTQVTYSQSQGSDQHLLELVKYFKKATTIKTPVACNALTLSDARLAETSLLFMTYLGPEDQPSEYRKKALGEFLRRGGLLYAEDTSGSGIAGTSFDQMFKALIKDPLVLGSQGGQWKTIPNEHPLYSSYFEFSSGPPLMGAGTGNVTYLEMIELRGRVAVILSELNLSRFWRDVEAESRELGLRFGVNLIVFTMAQQAASGLAPDRRP